ncbi:MAG TPA: hypothetical protein VEI97_14575 [bacterium]|nr:hypothetical protein [bacterium]
MEAVLASLLQQVFSVYGLSTAALMVLAWRFVVRLERREEEDREERRLQRQRLDQEAMSQTKLLARAVELLEDIERAQPRRRA